MKLDRSQGKGVIAYDMYDSLLRLCVSASNLLSDRFD